MTTATTQSISEQKVCGQFFASVASAGILIHFIHEAFAVSSGTSALQLTAGVALVGAVWAIAHRPLELAL